MKQIYRLLWIPLAVLCLCLGTAHTNLDDTAAVTGISMDIDPINEQFIFGFEIAKPTEGDNVEGTTCQVSAPDLTTALTAAAGVYPKPLACISTDLVLISEEIASHHIKEVCRMILQDWEGDPRAEIAVVQGKSAFAALSLAKSVDIRAVSLAEQLQLARKNKVIESYDALAFSVRRMAGNKLPLPLIHPHEKGYTIIGYHEEKTV